MAPAHVVCVCGAQDRYAHHARSLAVTPGVLPVLAAERAGEHYVYGGSLQSAASVTTWVDLVLKRTLRPTVRSAPPPLHTIGPLHSIVASTFESSVLQSDRDVLLLVTAPWCAECAAVEHVFEKVAEAWAPHPTVLRVATFDAGSNDLPRVLDVAALPTILFFTSPAAATRARGGAPPAGGRQGGDEYTDAPTSAVESANRVPLDLSAYRTEAALTDAVVQYASRPLTRPLDTTMLHEALAHLPRFQQQAQALLNENGRLKAELAEAKRRLQVGVAPGGEQQLQL